MTRLSQAIAEGDGISVLVEVHDGSAAGTAQGQGADGLAVRRGAHEIRAASQLPVLYFGTAGDAQAAAADAVVVPPEQQAWDEARELGLECVVRVSRSEEIEDALDDLDPEVFLLAVDPDSEEAPLEVLLGLLHDVPAGKLAIAELHDATADDVAELERAGVDAVLVGASDVATLVPVEPPEV